MPFNKKQAYYFLLLIVAATIPFPVKTHASGYLIIALGLSWLILGNWKNKWLQLKNNPLSFLFLGYYLILLAGFFYSEDKTEAKYLLEKNLGMFVLPLIILSGPKLNEKNVLNIGKAFILGCGIMSFIALIKAGFMTITYGVQFLEK